MKKILCRYLFCAVFLISYVFATGTPWATLGESVDSIESDRKALTATRGRTTVQDCYTVHEINRDGTTVREYVSSSGVVFAVAWNGIGHPDLTTLLGSYHEQYQTALEETTRPRGMRSLTVSADDVVVQKWGHVRSLHGRAYVPELVPAGVNIDEID
jgi:hypothetical protein